MKSIDILQESKKSHTQPQLNETTKVLIQDLMDIIILDRMQQCYNVFKQNAGLELYFIFLRSLPIIEYSKFISTVDKFIDSESDSAAFLKLFSKLLNSEDIEFLSTNSELYKDVLTGRICAKPSDDIEALGIVHAIQKMLKEKYYVLLEKLEVQYDKDQESSDAWLIGSSTYVDTNIE